MGANVYQGHSVLRFPTFFSFSKRLDLGKSNICLKDVSSPFERNGLHLTVSCCIGSEENGGNQPPRRRNKNDGTKRRGSGGRRSKSSNQEEIISLFRRIQTLISKEESVNAKKIKINSNATEESPSSDSILRALRGSRTRKGKAAEKEAEKVLLKGREDAEEVTEFKLIRPPSNFVKKSPIPSPSVPDAKVRELNTQASPSAPGTDEFDFVRVAAMKLPELKELAKSRGIRGYSKLKKSELVELLKA